MASGFVCRQRSQGGGRERTPPFRPCLRCHHEGVRAALQFRAWAQGDRVRDRAGKGETDRGEGRVERASRAHLIVLSVALPIRAVGLVLACTSLRRPVAQRQQPAAVRRRAARGALRGRDGLEGGARARGLVLRDQLHLRARSVGGHGSARHRPKDQRDEGGGTGARQGWGAPARAVSGGDLDERPGAVERPRGLSVPRPRRPTPPRAPCTRLGPAASLKSVAAPSARGRVRASSPAT